jgi:hypothetical protein
VALGKKVQEVKCDSCQQMVNVVQPLQCEPCGEFGIKQVCAECADDHSLQLEQEEMYKYYKGEINE